jgi:hypothetical protein
MERRWGGACAGIGKQIAHFGRLDVLVNGPVIAVDGGASVDSLERNLDGSGLVDLAQPGSVGGA